MKVLSVIGATNTGKTTFVEKLIASLNQRGYSVGTIKQIPFEKFEMDSPGKDTYRHKAAGAEMVTAWGKGETDILIRGKMPIDELLKFYTQDIVILESIADYPAPCVMAAATVEDIERKWNDSVFAITGIISRGDKKEYRGRPILSQFADLEKLTDLVLENLK